MSSYACIPKETIRKARDLLGSADLYRIILTNVLRLRNSAVKQMYCRNLQLSQLTGNSLKLNAPEVRLPSICFWAC